MKERTCGLCNSGAVQDEKHILLGCTDARCCALRSRFSDLLEGCGDDMSQLMQGERARDLSWFVHACMRTVDLDYHKRIVSADLSE